MGDRPRPRRDAYPYVQPVTTRWCDNDAYGHVNNAYYYAFFDTVVNRYLIEEGGLDVLRAAQVGYVAASQCAYFAPVAYPDPLEVGVRAERLGTTSAQYAVALFRAGDEVARAAGTMVHVFVDRASGTPAPIPPRLREALERISGPGGPVR